MALRGRGFSVRQPFPGTAPDVWRVGSRDMPAADMVAKARAIGAALPGVLR